MKTTIAPITVTIVLIACFAAIFYSYGNLKTVVNKDHTITAESVLAYINYARTAKRIPALTSNDALVSLAAHNITLSADELGNYDPNDANAYLQQIGYRPINFGQITGFATTDDVTGFIEGVQEHTDLMKLMLDPDFKEVGIVVLPGINGKSILVVFSASN